MSRLIGNNYIAGGTVVKNTGTFTTNPSTTSANIMIVAGGGSGGGYNTGSGAGAGGLVFYKDTPLSGATGYAVVIGAGGAAPGPSQLGPVDGAVTQRGSAGSDSSFASLTTAVGGGGGGVIIPASTPAVGGGSGGGSAAWGPWFPAGYTAGTGTPNQGTAGGIGNAPAPAGATLITGAGGGAGGPGGDVEVGWGGIAATDGSTTVYDHEGSSPATLNIGTNKKYAGGGGGCCGADERTAIPGFPESGYMYMDMGRYQGGNGYRYPPGGNGGGGSGAFGLISASPAPPSGYPTPARYLNAGWGDTNTGGGGGAGVYSDGGAPQANPFFDTTHTNPWIPSGLTNISRGGGGGSGVVVVKEHAVSGGVWDIKQQFKQKVADTWV